MNQAAPQSYNRTQKLLHWGVVALLLAQYVIFDGMGRPFDATVKAGSPVWSTASVAHMFIGVAVLALALWRLALRLRHGALPAPEGEPEQAKIVAKVTHGLIYVLLLGLPLGGLGAWFLGSKTLASVHEIGTTVLLWVVGLHVAGVLVHQFWWKTRILRRMV